MCPCVDHLNFIGEICPDCNLPIDAYGNTEEQFCDYCAFPDCGCDGSRLCQAKHGASDDAFAGNVEGMWSGKTREQRRAAFHTLDLVLKRDKPHD